MQVEQLFIETLVDVDRKLANNPGEYELLKVAGLLRPLLLETLLDDASAAAGLDVRFRVVKAGPPPISPEEKQDLDARWGKDPRHQPRDQAGDLRRHSALSVDRRTGSSEPTGRPGG